MKTRFGFIGAKEIEAAKDELIRSYRYDDRKWMDKNIWFEKPHRGDHVRGYSYDDVEEVLANETYHSVDVFNGINDVRVFAEENDYSFSDEDMESFKTIFKNNKKAYMVDGEIGDDIESLCWDRIEDGRYIWKGTVKDAYERLCGEHDDVVELIAIGVLK